MTGEDFISIATQLLAGNSEAHYRSAVSRAYFGAFHVARDFVRSCGILVSFGPEAHKSVRWCLGNAGSDKLADAARQLESLRLVRNKADYDLTDRRFEKRPNAAVNVNRAIEIATVIRADDTTDAAAKMRAYAKSVNLPIE